MNGAPTALVIIMILALVVLIGLVVHLSMKVKILERKYRRFMRGKDAVSLETAFADKFAEMERIDAFAKSLRGEIRDLRNTLRHNFTKYGILKYDAFEDVGGRLSFVLALLNDEDSGIVLNAIHSRDNCFLYLKEIVNGQSYIMLSDEEVKALLAAKKFESEEDEQKVMSTLGELLPAKPEPESAAAGKAAKRKAESAAVKKRPAESAKAADVPSDTQAEGSVEPEKAEEPADDFGELTPEEIAEVLADTAPDRGDEDLDDFDEVDPDQEGVIPREWQSAEDDDNVDDYMEGEEI